MNKSNVKNLQELEEYYSTNRKFRFKNNFKPENIKDVFIKLNDYENNATEGVRKGYHCNNKKLRSIDDLITICKYYFPKKSVKEILTEVKEHLNLPVKGENGKTDHVLIGYCGNIKKHNFWHSVYLSNDNNNKYLNVKFNRNGFGNLHLTIKDIIG